MSEYILYNITSFITNTESHSDLSMTGSNNTESIFEDIMFNGLILSIITQFVLLTPMV